MNKIFQENYEEIFDTEEALDSLWGLLLNLGVRGKLVSQDPTEEPASVFLDRIKTGKKIKNARKIKKIIDTETPFNIPGNWEWARLGEIANFTIGKTPPSKNPIYWDLEEGIPWVSIADMPLQGFIDSTTKRITAEAKERIFKREPVDADVLLMSFKLTIGKVALTKFPVFHNEAIISFEDIYSIELRNFLFWTLPLLSNLGKKKGAIKGKTLNSESISNLLIPMPPLPEQVRIVKKLEKLKEKIDFAKEKIKARNKNREQLNKASLKYLSSKDDWKFVEKNFDTIIKSKLDVDNLRKTILNLAIRGKLVPQNPSDEPASVLLDKIQKEKEKLSKEKKIRKEKPIQKINDSGNTFNIPDSWELVTIGSITVIGGGKRVPVGYKLQDKPTKHVYIRVTDMVDGSIKLNNLKYISDHIFEKIKNYTISKDDLYMTIVGATIGKCGKVPEELHNMNLTENAIKVTPILINKEYLYRAMCSPTLQDQFIDKTKQVGVQKMAIYRFKSTVLSLPPLAEQMRIVEKIDQLMQLCDRIENQIEESDKTSKKLVDAILRQV